MSKGRSKSNQSLKWVAVGGAVLIIVLVAVITVLLLRPAKVVSNFEQCKAAGGALLESYPEQCMINGSSFTNIKVPASGNGYIGMLEAAALAKAKQSNVPARVVERDGESLPITLDFTFGRNNLYVKDGKVYKN